MIILVPAYGRKYETLEEVKKDFYEGKDFRIFDGPYCSERDAKSMLSEYGAINIYYGAKRDLVYKVTLTEYNKNRITYAVK